MIIDEQCLSCGRQATFGHATDFWSPEVAFHLHSLNPLLSCQLLSISDTVPGLLRCQSHADILGRAHVCGTADSFLIFIFQKGRCYRYPVRIASPALRILELEFSLIVDFLLLFCIAVIAPTIFCQHGLLRQLMIEAVLVE